MKNILKLSEGQVTDLKNNSFAKARISLSVLYTIVFGILVLILSGIFYYLFAADIHEDMSNVWPDLSEQTRIINQHKGKLRNLMVLIDGGILLFIAGSSYYLAGKTLKPIEENFEAQKRFIADASHDLRTPIAILKADVEVNLQNKNISRSMKLIFKSYLEEINQMRYIVENLLTLFRFDSNQIVLMKESIDLKHLVTLDANAMCSYAKTKKVSINLNSNHKMQVFGDSYLLRQAIRNILKNAIEYSVPGSIIKISLKKENRMGVLTVNNNGIIISKKELEHVFDRFYRSDRSRTKRREGSGLGLPVTKYIIEKHGGKITIASSISKGTTVSLFLPLN